jgi:hypothetical protein
MSRNDIIDIDINEIAASIDEASDGRAERCRRDAIRADDRLARRELRKQRRARARGYEDMLIQRDAIASRANRLVATGDALVVAIEAFLDGLSEDTEPQALSDLRRSVGDAVDDFDCVVGNLKGGDDE